MAYKESLQRKAHHPYEAKEKMINRMNRIEGQIRGISKMIENDLYCDDIFQVCAKEYLI